MLEEFSCLNITCLGEKEEHEKKKKKKLNFIQIDRNFQEN